MAPPPMLHFTSSMLYLFFQRKTEQKSPSADPLGKVSQLTGLNTPAEMHRRYFSSTASPPKYQYRANKEVNTKNGPLRNHRYIQGSISSEQRRQSIRYFFQRPAHSHLHPHRKEPAAAGQRLPHRTSPGESCNPATIPEPLTRYIIRDER